MVHSMATPDGCRPRMSSRDAAALPPPSPYREERVRFPNSAGSLLHGVALTRWPEQPFAASRDTGTERSQCAVVCHGMAANTDWGFLPALAAALLRDVARLHAVFRFDFTGCGASEGVFEFGGYRAQVADLSDVHRFLRSQGYDVDTVIGHSMGGNTALLFASAELGPIIPNVVSVSARYRMTRGLPFSAEQLAALSVHGYFLWQPKCRDAVLSEIRVTQSSLDERLALDMDCVTRMPQRCMIVHGTRDTVIPVEDAVQLGQKVPRPTLRTIEGADHNFRSAEIRAMLIDTVTEWLADSHTGTPYQQV